MKSMTLRHLVFCLLWPVIASSQSDQTALAIGDQLTISSTFLGENRVINIYKTAASDVEVYDVIYLLDGTLDQDFMHIAGLVQFFTMMYKMPPTLVVGIANVDRKRDFSFPTTNEKLKADFPTTGGSEKFISFIESELQPEIERLYATSGRKMLIGQSLGGLLATEIIYKKPEMFTDFLIVSPSIWWDDHSLKTIERKPIPKSTRVIVSVGKEGRVMQKDAKQLHRMLKKDRLEVCEFQFLKKEDHATILHNAIYGAFLKMYAPRY
ncbi:MAG: alpha/beta hydrolase [Cryomorphaceae bacterium]|nr:alpha/beta hydrolase [Cryomorphaceae bacterium]